MPGLRSAPGQSGQGRARSIVEGPGAIGSVPSGSQPATVRSRREAAGPSNRARSRPGSGRSQAVRPVASTPTSSRSSGSRARTSRIGRPSRSTTSAASRRSQRPATRSSCPVGTTRRRCGSGPSGTSGVAGPSNREAPAGSSPSAIGRGPQDCSNSCSLAIAVPGSGSSRPDQPSGRTRASIPANRSTPTGTNRGGRRPAAAVAGSTGRRSSIRKATPGRSGGSKRATHSRAPPSPPTAASIAAPSAEARRTSTPGPSRRRSDRTGSGPSIVRRPSRRSEPGKALQRSRASTSVSAAIASGPSVAGQRTSSRSAGPRRGAGPAVRSAVDRPEGGRHLGRCAALDGLDGDGGRGDRVDRQGDRGRRRDGRDPLADDQRDPAGRAVERDRRAVGLAADQQAGRPAVDLGLQAERRTDRQRPRGRPAALAVQGQAALDLPGPRADRPDPVLGRDRRHRRRPVVGPEDRVEPVEVRRPDVDRLGDGRRVGLGALVGDQGDDRRGVPEVLGRRDRAAEGRRDRQQGRADRRAGRRAPRPEDRRGGRRPPSIRRRPEQPDDQQGRGAPGRPDGEGREPGAGQGHRRRPAREQPDAEDRPADPRPPRGRPDPRRGRQQHADRRPEGRPGPEPRRADRRVGAGQPGRHEPPRRPGPRRRPRRRPGRARGGGPPAVDRQEAIGPVGAPGQGLAERSRPRLPVGPGADDGAGEPGGLAGRGQQEHVRDRLQGQAERPEDGDRRGLLDGRDRRRGRPPGGLQRQPVDDDRPGAAVPAGRRVAEARWRPGERGEPATDQAPDRLRLGRRPAERPRAAPGAEQPRPAIGARLGGDQPAVALVHRPVAADRRPPGHRQARE